MKIIGTTKITGIFGYPISHTLSPLMHNAAFEALKLNYVYIPFEVFPKDLSNACNALKALNIRGVNITIPHKEKVIKYLDKIDPLAKAIGSVNTIVNEDGMLIGYNTDGRGFIKDLETQGFKPKDKTIFVLGAGGAGRAIISTLSWMGAREIFVMDKNEIAAKNLSQKINKVVFVPFGQVENYIKDLDLFVNATPVGMHDSDPSIIKDFSNVNKNLFVYDLVYHRKTSLVVQAEKAGIKSSNGLGMLIYQGALSFELWTGKKAPISTMRNVLLKALRK